MKMIAETCEELKSLHHLLSCIRKGSRNDRSSQCVAAHTATWRVLKKIE